MFSFRKIGFLRSVNPSSLHPPKIIGRHAVPSSLQVFHQFTSHSTRWLRRAHRVEVKGGIACVEPFAGTGRGRPSETESLGLITKFGRGRPLHIHKALPFGAILF